MGKLGAAVAAGVGTGSSRCRNGWRAVAAAEVGVPLTLLRMTSPQADQGSDPLPPFVFGRGG
jgi:hypothetical protein